MTEFVQQVVLGLSNGTIYAVLGLALVLVNRVSGTINFAQGEMATMSAFVAWAVAETLGWPFALAVIISLVASFAVGGALQYGLVAPVARRSGHNGLLLLTVGLFYLIDGVTGAIWGYSTRSFPSPLSNKPTEVLGVYVSQRELGTLGAAVVVVLACSAFFRFTTLGLAMRAAARQPLECQLLGISSAKVQIIGWGMAAVVGAVAAMLIAPIQFLEPTMLQPPLLFAFAAVVLGGADSMVGSVVAGLLLGVLLALMNRAFPSMVTLNAVLGFAVIILVLYVKPNGLFGRAVVQRA
jgi:branched-chain amino acid transport system permease protein